MWDITCPKDPERVKALQEKLREYYARLQKDVEPFPTIEIELKPQEREQPEAKRRIIDMNEVKTSRFDSFDDDQMDAFYKIIILERLFTQGSIQGWEMNGEIKNLVGKKFKAHKFIVALAVIVDYCMTGGRNVRGGTGLKRTG